MAETDTPTPRQTPERPARSGGRVLAWLAGGLIIVGAVIGWFLYAGEQTAAPEPPEVKLDIPMPEPRLPTVPDRPAPPDLPRPIERPNLTTPAAASTPGPET